MVSKENRNKWPIDFGKKVVLIALILFSIEQTQAQNITPEYQLKVLKINPNESPLSYSDSLIKLPLKLEFNRKIFLNDTIEKPNTIRENTTLHFEKKIILLSNPNSTFLFQIKNKRVEYYENELVEHYYCKRGNKPYLVTLTKTGIYIRRENSYYSSFFYNEES